MTNTPQDLADRLEQVWRDYEDDVAGGLPTNADRIAILASLRRSAPASGETREAVLAEREACAKVAQHVIDVATAHEKKWQSSLDSWMFVTSTAQRQVGEQVRDAILARTPSGETREEAGK